MRVKSKSHGLWEVQQQRCAQDGQCENPVPGGCVVWGRCIREGFLEEAQESWILKDGLDFTG